MSKSGTALKLLLVFLLVIAGIFSKEIAVLVIGFLLVAVSIDEIPVASSP